MPAASKRAFVILRQAIIPHSFKRRASDDSLVITNSSPSIILNGFTPSDDTASVVTRNSNSDLRIPALPFLPVYGLRKCGRAFYFGYFTRHFKSPLGVKGFSSNQGLPKIRHSILSFCPDILSDQSNIIFLEHRRGVIFSPDYLHPKSSIQHHEQCFLCSYTFSPGLILNGSQEVFPYRHYLVGDGMVPTFSIITVNGQSE